MVIQIGDTIPEKDVEYLVNRVFFKSIEILGGLNKLAEYRTLTWLPSLARAAFVIILKEEYIKSDEEIAQKVGLSKNTVRNILKADPELALKKLKAIEEMIEEGVKELKVHIAGGIAKLAYKEVKEGKDAQTLFHFCSIVAEDIAKIFDIPWAYLVLKKTKGINYPITSPEVLEERLKGIKIRQKPIEEIIKNLEYPIKTPAQLLHEIKEYLRTSAD